jgi:hypothetical protein
LLEYSDNPVHEGLYRLEMGNQQPSSKFPLSGGNMSAVQRLDVSRYSRFPKASA